MAGKMQFKGARAARADNRSRFLTALMATLLAAGVLVVAADPAGAVNAPVARRDVARTNPGVIISTNVIANDHDPDGHAFGVASVQAPTNGTATLTGSVGGVGGSPVYSNINFTPAAGFSGVETITYTLRDSTDREGTGTLTVVVSATNTSSQLPVAHRDFFVAPEGGSVSFTTADLLANDFDPQGQAMAVAAVADSSSSGSVTGSPATGYTYTPQPGFTGTDTIRYVITDTDGNASTIGAQNSLSWNGNLGHIQIEVEPTGSTNNAPTTRRDINRTNPIGAVSTNVLANDLDPDGDALGVVSVDQVSSGTVDLIGSAPGGLGHIFVSYVPSAGFSGVETITYTVRDARGLTSTGTLRVAVSATNSSPQFPVAEPDYFVVPQGGSLPLTAAALMANDFDPQGQTISLAEMGDSAQGGEVSGNPTTGFTYTPPAGHSGPDTIRYVVADTDGNFSTLPGVNTTGTDGTIYIQVEPTGSTNNAPVARRDLNRMPLNTSTSTITTNVVANDFDPDGDPITLVSAPKPANGTITSLFSTSITYRPDVGFSGLETISYTIRDSGGLLGTGTLQVAVSSTTSGAGQPLAEPDYRVIDEGDTLSFTAAEILANDTDPTDQTLTVLAVSDSVQGGQVTGGPATGYTYTPRPGFTGTDHIRYVITDTDGQVSPLPGVSATGTDGTIYVQVEPTGSSNTAPVTRRDVDRMYLATGTNTVTTNVLANDFDPDGDPITVVAAAKPANGTIVGLSTTSVSYRPDAGFTGIDTVTYTIRDSGGLLTTGTLQIAVSTSGSTIGQPVANRDVMAMPEGPTATFTAAQILANDTDPAGQALSVVLIGDSARGGQVTGSAATGFTYTPPAGLTGSDYIRYVIADTDGQVSTFGSETSATGVGYIEFQYQPPLALVDTVITPADTPVAVNVLANDSHPGGWAIQVTDYTQPAHGTVTCAPTGMCEYAPASGYTGPDQFNYTISDAMGGTATATVVIAVGIDVYFTADIVFAIDESGSMAPAFDQMKDNLALISTQLFASGLDTRLGLVGYGSGPGHDGHPAIRPHIHSPLTTVGGFQGALNDLVDNGGTEPAREAIVTATSDELGFREGAGVCVVVITDEVTNGDLVTQDEALAALQARDATLFTVGPTGSPDPTSGLVAATGGAAFPISGATGFLNDPALVLNALLQGCAGSIVEGIHLVPATAAGTVGETHTVTAVVRDSLAQPVVGTTVDFEVTSGPHAGTTSSGVTNSSGEVAFSYAGTATGDDTITASFLDSQTSTVRTAEASITWVLPPNVDPTAVDDAYGAPESSLVVSAPGVLGNDTDPDGDLPLTAALVSGTSNGTLALNADGSFTYVAASGFSGTDSFSYRAMDARGGSSNAATVTITVPAPAFTISGTVTAQNGGTPVEGAVVMAFGPGDFWIGSHHAVTDDQGNYTIHGIEPGADVRVVASVPGESGLVSQWYQTGWDASTTPFIATTAGPVTGIDFALRDTARISGTVTDGTGLPLDGVSVRAYRPGMPWIPIAVTTTGPDGTYSLIHLVEGDHMIRFDPPTPDLNRQWYTQAERWTDATVVSVPTAGSASGIDAVLE